MRWCEVHWPRPLERAPLIGLLTRVAADRQHGPLVWEARAEAGRVRYLLGGQPTTVTETSELLQTVVAGATTTPYAGVRRNVERAGNVRIRQRSLALALDGHEHVLRALLAALASATGAEDVLVMQIVLGRAVPPQLLPSSPPDPDASVWSLLTRGVTPAGADTRASMKHKLAQYRFQTAVRVGVAARQPERRRLLTHRVLAGLRQLQSGGTRVELATEPPDAVDAARVPLRLPLHLTPEEALALLVWPHGTDELPGIPALHPRPVPPPARYKPVPERAFAVTTAPGPEVPIGIGMTDALRHTHILGPTGVGKSTVLLHLIRADLAGGRSVVVIDPKRDLGMDVLALVPEQRLSDVVVIDPTLPRPVGVNPLASSNDRRALVADNVLAIFKGLFPSAFGPRTSDVMHASLLTLMAAPGATLVQLPALLTDAAFRRGFTTRIDDPAGLGAFWQQWEAMSPAAQAQAIGPVMSRLRQFLLRPGLRAVLDQPEPRFSLSELFTTPRIVIVTLNKGLLGAQSAALLGSLIVSQLWHLTQARAALPQRERAPVSVYLDEAQNFLHLDGDLGEALEQSRSLGVAWHLAHQHRRQMPPDLMASIDANTRNKIAFTLETADAKAAASSGHLEPEDFEQLPPFHIYASLLSEGWQTGWFSGRTLPPPAQLADPDAVILESQTRYGNDPLPRTPAPAPQHPPADDEPIGRVPRGTP